MNNGLHIVFRKSMGNYHYNLKGALDDLSARDLINMVRSTYEQPGKVFIDTRELAELSDSATGILREGLAETAVPPSDLIFKGDKGGMIAPDGCRVLKYNKVMHLKCRGGCRCQPSGQHAHQAHGPGLCACRKRMSG